MQNNDLNGLITPWFDWMTQSSWNISFLIFEAVLGAEKTSYKKFLQWWIWNQGKLGQVNPANFGVDWTSYIAFTLMELINFQ